TRGEPSRTHVHLPTRTLLGIGAAVAIAERAAHAVEAAGRNAIGDEIHDAADRVGAVENRCWSAHDLDPIDRRDIDDGRQLTEVLLATRVPDADAILEQQDALPALAANGRPGLVGAYPGDVEARKIPKEIGRRIGRRLTNVRRVQHRDGDRRVVDV